MSGTAGHALGAACHFQGPLPLPAPVSPMVETDKELLFRYNKIPARNAPDGGVTDAKSRGPTATP